MYVEVRYAVKFSSLTIRWIKLQIKRVVLDLTYFLESFFIIVLNDNTTPYTSFASSSKGKVLLAGGGGALLFATGLTAATSSKSSFTATTTPEVEISVFLGLLNVDATVPSAEGGWYETARDTPGRSASLGAGLGRFVRCQS